jgi:hypothetical protein
MAVDQSISTIMGSVDQLKASFRPSSQASNSASKADAQAFSDLQAENMVSPTWFLMIAPAPAYPEPWTQLPSTLSFIVPGSGGLHFSGV